MISVTMKMKRKRNETERRENLEKVIEDKNGKVHSSETVETVLTEAEPIMKKRGKNSLQHLKRRSLLVQ